MGDGCGGTLECGTCPQGETCGGRGIPNVCAVPPCQPTTCEAADAECGAVPDGCGGTLQCGLCPDPEICGTTNVCGPPAAP
jgi:hypothetical protein